MPHDRIIPEPPIAIVGMACLFPNAPDLKAFWRLLRCGLDGITDVPPTHWSPDDYFDADPKAPDMTYCRRGGFLATTPFDPSEFGIPPSALEATDTSQLLGLIVAKAALEDVGHGNSENVRAALRADTLDPSVRQGQAARLALNPQSAISKSRLEDRNPQSLDPSRVSVLLGVTGTQELVIPLGARLGHPIWRKALREAGIDAKAAESIVRRIADGYVPWQENSFPGLLGNVVAGRIANRLNLGGTNCVIDAACASSLAAIHLAIMELNSRRSDLVLSGGIDALNDIFMHMCFSKTPALSPTGDARPFASDADGTVLGEGLGIVALKRLEDARRDGDRIYAVIRSVGASSDGRQNSIYAPHAAGQAEALRRAYAAADIDPRTIELVEAHGTGTKVGDAVECESLRMVFGEAPGEPWCALGSVKSQIGHTKAAAGVAGLIKAALALHHNVLPPTLKVREPNPKLSLDAGPFYINTESRPWPAPADHPRRAAVSSFGFGGSNFHLVLEEAVSDPCTVEPPASHWALGTGHWALSSAVAWDASVEIVAISAAAPHELTALLDTWRSVLSSDAAHWPGVAFHAARSRQAFSAAHRLRLVIVVERPAQQGPRAGESADPAVAQLSRLIDQAREALARDADHAWSLPGIYFSVGLVSGKLALLFPGQGSQYLNMARDVACVFTEVRDAVDEAEAGETPLPSSVRISEAIYPRPVFADSARREQQARLTRTDVAQPALAAISLGMLRVLDRFGVHAHAAAGHSFGELVALHAAGRIDAASLHELARLRGRAMAAGASGAMLAVEAPLADIERLLSDSRLDVVLANRNAPTQGVLSGPCDAVRRAAELCQARGFRTRDLPVASAFHSPLMVEAQAAFRRGLAGVEFKNGRIPVLANCTGDPYPDDPAAVRDLLANQITSPVQFVRQIETLYASGVRLFIEVGPRSVLTGLTRSILGDRPAQAWSLDASAGQRSGLLDLARVLGQLAAVGVPVDLSQWEEPPREPRTPRMCVPLTGANYRAPRSEGSATQSESANAAKPRQASPLDHVGELELVTKQPTPPRVEPTPADSGLLADALRLAQDGLRAMQQLQQQTAQAHQRFLEGQSLAHQTFQTLMAGQQRLFEQALGLPGAASVSPPYEGGARGGSPPSPPARVPDQERPATNDPPKPLGSQHPALSTTSRLAALLDTAPPRDPLDHAILCVISEKTGYPLDQLAPHLLLDDDLGIDPIRRSEIAASVLERRGAAPAVNRDALARLATVADLIAWLRAAESSSRMHTVSSSPPYKGGARGGSPASSPHNPKSEIRNPKSPDAAAFADTLLAVVAELTGYPREMLALDMDMEADLGIDSIKRVEILAAVQERVPGVQAVNPEYMGSLRTLRQIVDYSTGGNGAPSASTAEPVAAARPDPGGPPRPFDDAPSACAAALDRRVLGATPLPPAPAATLSIAAHRELWIVADAGDLAARLVARLAERGHAARRVDLHHPPSAADRPALGGLIFVAPSPQNAIGLHSQSAILPRAPLWPENSESYLKSVFTLTQAAAPELRAAAAEGGALFATVARMDGCFGLSGGDFDACQGGLAGLVKTAAHEWPAVRCRARDVARDWTDADAIAEAILRDLAGEGPIEVGLTPGARCGLSAIASPSASFSPPYKGGARGGSLVSSTPNPQSPIRNPQSSPADLILLTGGARGVTAECAVALAGAFHPTLALLGRSPAPSPEPAWLADLTDPATIKRAIMQHEFPAAQNVPPPLAKGGPGGVRSRGAAQTQIDSAKARPTPAQIEASLRRHMANREIARTLARVEAAGARVEYRCVDVRDARALRDAIDDLRSRHGPVRGLIHAAGVLEDRRIEDKTAAQFDAVFDTKVAGLRVLLDVLDAHELRCLVLFSSVTARFGRQGQVDYAMANEVLNKAAHRFAAAHPQCRTVSINWGPWDGGMVNASLRREFQRLGVPLIDPAAGAAALVAELSRPDPDGAEVLLGADFSPANAIDSATSRIVTQRTLDVATHPFLDSHCIAGRPVLPVAIIADWLADAALRARPDRRFIGLDNLRILRGVILKDSSHPIRIALSEPRFDGGITTLDAELRGGPAGPGEILHARARVLLADEYPPPSAFTIAPGLADSPYRRGMDSAYAEVLFHGPHFHGIERIEGLSDRGLVARLRAAPPPSEWMTDPPRDAWLADPLILDAGFQLGILWCHERLGGVALPAFGAAYRQYRAAFPREGVVAVLEVRSTASHRMIADIAYLDHAGALVAGIEGCEWTVDASLAAAFRAAAVEVGA